MFTGIIEEIGTVKFIKKASASAQLGISCKRILDDVHLGDSIAVNGVCLTVTSFDNSGFTADVMHETLNRSSLGSLGTGSPVNLERAMTANGRFGGHIVSGHIDGTGTISKLTKDENAIWFRINCGDNLLRYIMEKGSIAIDGISLTVAKVHDDGFAVSIIPHTLSETILGTKTGDIVNLENDCIGKYIERLMGFDKKNVAGGFDKKEITMEFLMENGF